MLVRVYIVPRQNVPSSLHYLVEDQLAELNSLFGLETDQEVARLAVELGLVSE